MMPDGHRYYRDMAMAMVAAKSDGVCWYCGDLLTDRWVIEHVVPLSRGGTHDPHNLVPACRSCNAIKGNRTLEEFRPLIRQRLLGAPKFSTEQLKWLDEVCGIDPYEAAGDVTFWFEREGMDL